MDKVKDIVTGGAYEKPARTKDGAMTTQDSADAHTIENTSADPNFSADTTPDAGGKAQQLMDKAGDVASSAKAKADEKGLTDKAKATADEHGYGDHARQAEQKADENL